MVLARDAFEVTLDADVVTSLCTAAKGVLGREPAFIGENPRMDSALLPAAGVETVVFGPDGRGARSPENGWILTRSCN